MRRSQTGLKLRALGRLVACSAAVAMLCPAASAFAQLFRVGGSIGAIEPGPTMRGTDTAYDQGRGVYLLVVGNGPIYGIFVNNQGLPVTSRFTIMDGSAGWGHFPRAEYSPHVSNGIGGLGGFLVTWHHNVGSLNYVFGRLVSYDAPGRLVSAIQQISDAEQGGSWWETGPAMAYSRASRRFLVAWRTIAYGIRGRFVGTGGLPTGVAIQLENVGGSRDPALSWNPSTDEFGLVSSGWTSTSALAAFRRIRASDGVVSARTSFGFSAGTFATAIDVNGANQYVMTWALHPGTMSATFDQNGTQLATNFVTGRLGHDQSLGLAFNSISGTLLAVGSDHNTLEIAAVEVKGGGAPNSAAQIITDGAAGGSFYPMTTTRTGTNQWSVVYSRDFRGATSQIVATSSAGGGGSSPPSPAPPPPAPPPPPSGGCSTPDPFVSIGGGACVNGGWVPKGSTGGNSGGCTTPSPGVGWTCVNGGWQPPTGGGTSSGGCTTPDPFTSIGGGTCVNGGWIPGRSGSGGGTTTSCSTPSPGSGWTCVNGGWLPPGGVCTTPDPFTSIGGGTCVGGGWIPGGSGSGGGGSNSSCSTPSPGSGWTCVHGGWLPPNGGGSSTGGCTTPDPFASIGGGACINGGWVPMASSCTTPDPFVSLGGGVCSNGGWRPR